MLGLKRLNGPMRMLALVAALAIAASAGAETRSLDYRILATQKTSTMEKELNEAAAAGYRFSKVMGGQTANGGKEVVVAMIKDAGEVALGTRQYRLLATNKTSTMQKELQQAAVEGYEYKDQTVFESQYGGKEVAVIMERDPSKNDSAAVLPFARHIQDIHHAKGTEGTGGARIRPAGADCGQDGNGWR